MGEPAFKSGLDLVSVDATPLQHIYDAFTATGDKHAFTRAYPNVAAQIRKQAQGPALHPVAINGSRTKGLNAGYYQTRLADGTLGYLQRRMDDCLQAAIACVLQIPPHQVPDLHLDELVQQGTDPELIDRKALSRLGQWEQRHGITITVHPTPPKTERRWIAIVPAGNQPYEDHCLIMNRATVLFDPSTILPLDDDEVTAHNPAAIEYGITIQQ